MSKGASAPLAQLFERWGGEGFELTPPRYFACRSLSIAVAECSDAFGDEKTADLLAAFLSTFVSVTAGQGPEVVPPPADA